MAKNSSKRNRPKDRWSVGTIALWLGILASIVTITGYTLQNGCSKLTKPEPLTEPIQTPTQSIEKPTVPDTKQLKQKSSGTTNASKTNVTVGGNAQIGILNTGDSVTINAVQQINR